jgi:hypothetical protein
MTASRTGIRKASIVASGTKGSGDGAASVVGPAPVLQSVEVSAQPGGMVRLAAVALM